MRLEVSHNRVMLCGHILPAAMILPGQIWAPADGSNREVFVVTVGNDKVEYRWEENGSLVYHTKSVFSFQTRYCLVIDKVNDDLAAVMREDHLDFKNRLAELCKPEQTPVLTDAYLGARSQISMLQFLLESTHDSMRFNQLMVDALLNEFKKRGINPFEDSHEDLSS